MAAVARTRRPKRTRRLRWKGRAPRRPRLDAVALTGLVFFVLVAGLGIALWVAGQDGVGLDKSCGENALGCNIVVEGLGTIAAVAGAIVWFTYYRVRQVLRPHLDDLTSPSEAWRAVPTAAPMPEVVSRRGLCEIIETDLRPPHSRAQIVVAGVGDGKTALLVRLAELLYKRGAVPVAVALRDAPKSLDFHALAQEQFTQRVGRSILSMDEAEKVWRDLCQKRLVVVLADGLEEALTEIRPEERADHVQTALERARDSNLPLVITSRPLPLLSEVDAAVIRLEPLAAHRAVEHIEKARAEPDPDIRTVARVAEVMERPLYLKLARDVHEHGALDQVKCDSRIKARVSLLNVWHDLLRDGAVAPDVTMRTEDRGKALDTVAQIACAALAENTLEVKLETARQSWITNIDRHPEEEVWRRAEQARRLTLVEMSEDEVRFRHSILQAYLGARRLRAVASSNGSDAQKYVKAAVEKPSRELTMALVMFNLLRENGADAATLCRQLCRAALETGAESVEEAAKEGYVPEADPLRPRAFELLAAAYEVHALAPPSDELLLEHTTVALWEAEQGRPPTVETTEAKLRTILPVAEAGTELTPKPVAALWAICTLEDEYAIRFQAAHALADEGGAALTVLEPYVKPALKASLGALEYGADGGLPTAGWKEVRQYSVLGWVMPRLAATCGSDEGSEELLEVIGAWVHAATWRADAAATREEPLTWSDTRPGLHLGVEASLAQGFKWEANRILEEGADRRVRERLLGHALRLLDGSRWWQTQMAIIQALALWALDEDLAAAGRWETIRRIRRYARGSYHPLVKETARLCRDALAPTLAVFPTTKLRGPSRHIWIDEADVASKIGPAELPEDYVDGVWIPAAAGWSALAPPAQQLLGETLVLLNLIEDSYDPGAPLDDADRDAEVRAREDRRADTYSRGPRLPACVAQARDRGSLGVTALGAEPAPGAVGCTADCLLGLCPYPPPGRPPFRGHLPASFCRAQHRLLTGTEQRVPRWEPGMGTGRGWLKRRAFETRREFWRNMEQRAARS